MAGIEFNDVNLGYMDLDTQEVCVVSVPEQSNDTLVGEGSLLPGHVFSVGAAS